MSNFNDGNIQRNQGCARAFLTKLRRLLLGRKAMTNLDTILKQKHQLNHIPGLPWWPPTDPCPCPSSPCTPLCPRLTHCSCPTWRSLPQQVPDTFHMVLPLHVTSFSTNISQRWHLIGRAQVIGLPLGTRDAGKGSFWLLPLNGVWVLKWIISKKKAMCGHLSLGQHSPGCPAVILFFGCLES